MLRKVILIFVLVFGSIFIYRSSKFIDDKYLNYPPFQNIDNKNDSNNMYKVGAYSGPPVLSLYNKLSRKKINNYVFVLDNAHKVEIALVDLGYASVLNANYFYQNRSYVFEKDVGFTLPEDFNDHSFQINKVGISYELFYKSKKIKGQTVTDFHIKIFRSDNSFIHLTLKHVQPQNSCVTYSRKGIISYKCYGGYAEGTLQVQVENSKVKVYDLWRRVESQETTVAFDGLRGSGWQWQWIWGMGTGLSNGRHLSINFGSINNIGEDVIQVNNKVIPIKGIQYIINDNATIFDSIKLTSNEPQIDLQFKIKAKEHKMKDLGLLKVQMVKFEGYWSGHVIDSESKQTYSFSQFPGLVQTAHNIF